MTLWQTELMEENARNQYWEDLNAPDTYESEMKQASENMTAAVNAMDKATFSLMDAQSILAGTPMENVVGSIYESLLDLANVVKDLADKYGRGERD